MTTDESYARAAGCVREAIQELNTMRAPDERVPEAGDATLIGEGGMLDSLGLVNLAVALDASVERAFGVSPGLVAEILAAEDPAEFQTVDRLVQFVCARVGVEAS